MASMAGRSGVEAAPGQMAAAQRGRILQAMAEVVAERGFAGASTELVRARARVSRRTFEGLFASREECLAAVFDLGRRRTAELVIEAFAGAESWQEALRTMLASLLVMLDSEPVLARVWLVESLAAGPWALEYRERSIRGLQNLIVSNWPVSEGWREPPLAAEGLIASVLGIMHTHIVTGKPEPLIELLGPLMGQIARAYLPAGEAEREIELGAELALRIQSGEAGALPGDRHEDLRNLYRSSDLGLSAEDDATGPSVRIPPALSNPNAHRACQCLLFLAEQGDRGLHPSNREIAEGVGVAHQSQISKLLSDLLREGLVVKDSAGVGKRNAWRLTPQGHEIACALGTKDIDESINGRIPE
jgi:AcrR family transcriptional regulator